MKLADAVAQYVVRRRWEGLIFVHNEAVLKLFCSHCGEINLSELSGDQITSFIHSQKISLVTRSTRYSILNGFLTFYRVRGFMNLIQVQEPLRRRGYRMPIVYSQGQIRSMLNGASNITTKANCLGDEMDGSTFRMILLLLYATGATVEEVVRLRRSNIDLEQQSIEFKGTPRQAYRSLPMGRDLSRELCQYIRTQCKDSGDTLLFRFNSGRRIKRSNLWNRFGRVCRMVGIPASNDGHVPRLHDLRATFAVHRLTYAVRTGENLNRLIPALSTYLGSSVLTRAEHFLSFVPERFSPDLEKLSSTLPRTHWRDNPELLIYLRSL